MQVKTFGGATLFYSDSPSGLAILQWSIRQDLCKNPNPERGYGHLRHLFTNCPFRSDISHIRHHVPQSSLWMHQQGLEQPNPFSCTRPQPDYFVGFGWSAFTKEQLKKLKPFVGEIGSTVLTYFMTTTQMYFSFLTYEVKCSAVALEIADQ